MWQIHHALADGTTAMRIAVMSLTGTLHFGLCADPTLPPDVEHLAESIEEEADALVAIPARR